jgi:hypothetical protein
MAIAATPVAAGISSFAERGGRWRSFGGLAKAARVRGNRWCVESPHGTVRSAKYGRYWIISCSSGGFLGTPLRYRENNSESSLRYRSDVQKRQKPAAFATGSGGMRQVMCVMV